MPMSVDTNIANTLTWIAFFPWICAAAYPYLENATCFSLFYWILVCWHQQQLELNAPHLCISSWSHQSPLKAVPDPSSGV